MTLADLRLAIQQDLARDDLTDVVASFLKDRISYYSREYFWTSQQTALFTMAVGTSLYSIPANIISIDRVRLNYGGSWQDVTEQTLEYILTLDTEIPPTQSVPTIWAPNGAQMRFYPTPDATYPVEITGQGFVAAPVLDDDSNFWTEEAGPLIRYATTAQIRLLRLRDRDGFELDMVAVERERQKLFSETAMRQSNDDIQAWW